jgi:predicted metalloprotease
MRWRGRRKSGNVEDRRGTSGGATRGRLRLPGGFRRGGAGGGGIRFPRRMSRGGMGGLGMVVVVLALIYFGVDPSIVFQGMPGANAPPPSAGPQSPSSAEDNELAEFVSVVLADTEDTWRALFEQRGERYEEPKLVLFTDAVSSACGFAQAAAGPFYCPGDHKLYIDLAFYRDLKHRFSAPGDFAQAYVIAHEVAHHVQTLMGISEKVHALRRQASEVDANALSVRMELQADCLAGLWAHHADRQRQIIEPGDVDEALNAASAIGDDRLQRRTQGTVMPDSFTHGSSAQRVRWFKRGLESGRLESCDTFGTDRL